MNYLALIPGLLSLLLVAVCFVTKSKRRICKKRGFVSLPFAAAGIGMLALLFCIPATILLWQCNLLGLVFLFFCALGWFLMLGYCNCWLDYDGQGFSHSNLFGVQRRFAYTDVAPISKPRYKQALKGRDLRFRAGNCRILIDTMHQNREDFLLTLSERLRKDQWTTNVPRGWDPYGHNVPNGWFLFIMSQLMILFWIGMMVWCVLDYWAPEETEQTTDHLVLSFSDCRMTKNSWDLHAENGETYYLDIDVEKLGIIPDSLCDGRTQYDIWLYHGNRSICAIRTETGKDILTFAQTKELREQDDWFAMPIFLLFFAGSVWLNVGMIRTARHPERYAVCYRRLFWKDHVLLSDTTPSFISIKQKRYRRKKK